MTNTIETKLEAMNITMEELKFLQEVLQYIESQIEYCVGWKYDESYNLVRDEDGNTIKADEPKKGDFNYIEYTAKLNVRDKIMKLI